MTDIFKPGYAAQHCGEGPFLLAGKAHGGQGAGQNMMVVVQIIHMALLEGLRSM